MELGQKSSCLPLHGKAYALAPAAPAPDEMPTDVPADTLQVMRRLSKSIFHEIVIPALEQDSTAAFEKFMTEHFEEFCERNDAFRVLLALSLPRFQAERIALGSLDLREESRARLVRYGGDSALDEVDFAEETLKRAGAMVRRFADLGEPSDVGRDRELIGEFHAATAFFSFARCCLSSMLLDLARPNAEVTAEVFEQLRQSALVAYAVAREAFDLRKPSETLSLVPSSTPDEEDHELADEGFAEAEVEIARLEATA